MDERCADEARGGEKAREGQMISRDSNRSGLFVLAFVAVCLGHIHASTAAPSVWTSVRRPNAAARAVLIDKADKALNDAALDKERVELYSGLFLGGDAAQVGRIEARELLEQAGGATSPNMQVRLRYASVLRSLASDQKPANRKNIEEAAKILTTVLASRPIPAIALQAWDELALCHAVLGQREKEIHAYDQALMLEVVGSRRSMLMANRAESYMAMGRLDESIRGYREAFASLLEVERRHYGVTTLWGLAVALDRNGDMEDALEHIRLARIYDEFDERIKSDSWFYSPPYDEHWYKALGDWAKARATANSIDRTFEYGHALEAWDRYIDRAPENDPYVALAKVRRHACEIERERAARITSKPGSNIGGIGSLSAPVAPSP